jgi:radical SAM-linked protein
MAKSGREQGVPRRERLRAIAKLPGVYVPSLYVTKLDPDTGFEVVDAALVPEARLPITRALVDDLNRFPFPDDGPIGGPEAVFDRMSIEIARGCTEGCRFCQAGMIYRPVRERDPEQIVQTVVSAIQKSGHDEVSLTSLSTADYSCIAPLIEEVTKKLAPERVSLGVSSLRAYGLEENVLDDLQGVRATGLTFAPEAGSQRMRDVVNKNVTEAQLMETAERVFSRGWSSMKLYFMIGLPTEDETDVREIVRVGARARAIGKRVKKELQSKGLPNGGGAPKVTVSVSTHVPKPHTPFQWCAMDAADDVRKKQAWLDEERRAAHGVDLRMHDCDTSWLEAVFARGDRKLANVLEHAYRAGARFDSWEDQLRIEIWEEAFRAEGVDIAIYLGTIPVTARLPWSHIDVGLEDGFLAREYRKALANRLSLPCGKVAGMFVHHTNLADAEHDAKKLVCYDCGIACDLSAMRTERLVYLRRLGAETKRAPAVKPAQAPSGTETAAPRPVRPPVAFKQGAPERYRFAFTKLGASAFLSHLDLIRAIPRAFRRLRLPLHYSTGFHPKPEMTFGPALSLGVFSLGEAVDIKLASSLDPVPLLAELTASSPDGLTFFGACALGARDAALSRVVDTARYVIAIPQSTLADKGGGAWLLDRVEWIKSAPEIVLVRRIDGIGKRVNVKEYLRGIAVGDDTVAKTVRRAGILGDFATVSVDLEIRGSGAIKIAEVVEALAQGAELPHRAIRAAIGVWRGGAVVSPLDLSSLRAIAAAPPALVASAE